MANNDLRSGAAARGQRFLAAMQEQGAKAALISDRRHVFYLTGFLSGGRSPAFLLLRADERPLLVVGESEASAASDVEITPYEDYSIHRVVHRRGDAVEALAEAVRRYGLTRQGAKATIGVEADELPASVQSLLGDCERLDIAPILRAMRACKDADEQDRIRRSVAVTNAGHAAARNAAVAGTTEIEVYAEIQRACVLEAGQPIAFDGDFVSGERSWLIGGPPTDRVMREGDLFICDLFPTVGGYWADTTRTIAIGAPTSAQQELYEVVCCALERGRRAVRPGVPACEVYREVRAAIADAGYGDNFPHHAGHGIGLEPHESPMIIPADATALRPGMTITLEPGVYVAGVGGVRLENNYIVTDDGAEVIAPYPLGLEGG